jgi:hypothetical protein
MSGVLLPDFMVSIASSKLASGIDGSASLSCALFAVAAPPGSIRPSSSETVLELACVERSELYRKVCSTAELLGESTITLFGPEFSLQVDLSISTSVPLLELEQVDEWMNVLSLFSSYSEIVRRIFPGRQTCKKSLWIDHYQQRW